MGLLSFLFGGGKKEKAKPKAVAKPAAKPAEAPKAAKVAAKMAVVATTAKPVGVLPLKIAYAAHVRAGDHAKAYDAACRLAALYKKARAGSLAAEYRAAAEEEFGAMLLAAAKSRQAKLVARKLPLKGRTAKLLGEAPAKLVAAHTDFLAKLDGARA